MMKENFDITIKFADIDRLTMSISRKDEAMVRRVVYDIQKTYHALEESIGEGYTSHELLAMTVYQYAKRCFFLKQEADKAADTLADFEQRLDAILLDVG